MDDIAILWLYTNELTGEIPAELGSSPSLSKSLNTLIAESGGFLVSHTRSLLNNVVALDVSGNQMDGPIPAELGNLAGMSKWRFSDLFCIFS